MVEKKGKKIKRKKPTKTETGLVFTSKDCKKWQIRYPDGNKRYGGATSERVAIFFLLLGTGHSLENADDIAFRKTRKRRKKKK